MILSVKWISHAAIYKMHCLISLSTQQLDTMRLSISLYNADMTHALSTYNPTRPLHCSDTIAQVDGRANRSVTSKFQDLDYCWEIEPVKISGIIYDSVVECTCQCTYHLAAKSGYSKTLIIHFSPQDSHAVTLPNDAVAKSDACSS